MLINNDLNQAQYLSRPFSQAKEIFDFETIDTLLCDWSAEIIDDQFVIPLLSIRQVWVNSMFLLGEDAPDSLKVQPSWKLANKMRTLIGDDYKTYQLIITPLIKEPDFEALLGHMTFNDDIKGYFRWVVEQGGRVEHKMLAKKFNITEDTARKYPLRYKENFQRFGWTIKNYENCICIFVS